MAGTGEKKRKRLSPEIRRAEIVRAAVALFARQGFERTTTKEIAAAAGIAEGTIYKYFTSKQDILFSFIKPTATRTMPTIFQESIRDDRQLIAAFIEDRFALWEENADLVKVVIGEAVFNPALAEGLNRMIDPIITTFEQYISHRKQEGAFRDIDAGIAARTLIGMAISHFLRWNVFSSSEASPSSQKKLVDELTDLFLHGVCRLPQS
ncbi:MAG TPA: TetR/AcrR family transcriptional regulator [Armatimonadota bacterium]|nr:TetR/AcrR family transcriptional regulator [Armatimonadota bacterium]